MTVEEAAKLVISAGLVSPEYADLARIGDEAAPERTTARRER
jgi:uncharacterized membrane protein